AAPRVRARAGPEQAPTRLWRAPAGLWRAPAGPGRAPARPWRAPAGPEAHVFPVQDSSRVWHRSPAGESWPAPCRGARRLSPGAHPRPRRGAGIGPPRGDLGRPPAPGPRAYPPEPTACPATGPVNCPVVPPPFAPLWGGLRGGAAPVWRRDGCVRTAPPDHCAIHTAEAG